ncbi:DUF3344 domain-containing protein, partial [Methanobrevibacter sp.]|uniref:DUF3344 domain-containing protein n=1 Tax=Methanobrevibacter sp. TaxID=66852 RepID=UPI00386C9FEA
MIHKKSIPLLVLMFVLVLSISAVSAADSDNGTVAIADESAEILDADIDDGSLEIDNVDDGALEADNDDALSYPSSSSDSWIKFDEDEITINEGDSYTIHGTLYSGNSKNSNGNFGVLYSGANSGSVWIDRGEFNLDISSWNLPASATKYKLTFTPEDSMEYFIEFVEMGNPEMVESYVYITVNSASAPSTGTVHASVTSDNAGVPNAKVVLTGSETYTGTANRQGVCDIEDVLYGDYTVTVTANGYEELTSTVTVDGDEINLPLTLTKIDPLCGEDDSGIYLTYDGVVSGDAVIYSANPWETSGSLQVTLPGAVKDVKYAIVIINSYSGSGSSETYALHSDVTLTTDSTTTLGSEDLYYYGVQTNDPNIYVINDHTTKQYSDYQYVYDITDTVAALNAGSSLTINVANSRYGSYGFDARIKMITLFLAYDDDDNDKMTYWFGIGQSWTQGERHEIIPTASYEFDSCNITLETIALSSYYAQEYMINGELLNDPIEVLKGPYYIHAYWDTDECYIGDFFPEGDDMDFSFGASQEGWGSYKTNLLLFKEFEEEPLGDVYISVTDADGPVENANVVLSDGERTYTGTTDDLGLGTIDTVPYGDYTVTVTANGYEDFTGTFTVNDFANDLDVTLTALPTHSTVHVSVVCNNIEPIANANVVLSGDNTYTGTTDDEGVCDIQNVQYGDYTVTVTASGYKTLTSTVTVDSEEMDLPLAIKENIPTTVNKMYLFDTGVVSGEAKIISVNPWTTSGSLVYTLPEGLTNIKSAIVIINSYSGSGDSNTYGLHSDVTLTTDSTTTIGSEDLVYTGNQASDDTVYTINGHTTKQYSDYQYHYNITGAVATLNAGDSITISVSNSKIAGRNGFDGRIKMITLFLAYDDGDNDNITYWLDVGQHWTGGSDVQTDALTTRSYTGPKDNLTLQNIALSSTQAKDFKLNNNLIGNPTTIQSGSFYINAYWTSENNGLSDYFRQGSNTNFGYTNNGGSYKNVLVLLTATEKEVILPDIVVNALTTPWSEGVFAGVDNNLTVKINNQETDAVENVVVEVVSSEGNTVIAIETIDSLASGVTTLVINDPTIRDITEQTVSGQYNNNLVTYTVNVKYGDVVLDSKTYNKKIAYDGYLNKTYAYDGHDNQVNRVYTIDGDIIIASQDISKYADQFTRSRTETWDITLPEGAELVKAFLYFNYNWDTSYFPNGWTLTFDDADITNDYIALEKDQGNLGYYGAYGYGLAVFDVTDYFVDGENTFVIEKTGNCALYPSTLMVLYNQPGSTQIKDVYFTDICDVLYGYYNEEYAGKTNVFVPYEDINLTDMTDASWYVFAGSASGSTDGNLLFNGKEFNSIWSSYSSDNTCFAYLANVTDVISEDNDAWYLTNPKAMTTVVVYEQVLVVTKAKQVPGAEIAMNSEYTSVPSVYAGVENRLTVKVKNNGNVDGEDVLVNVFIGDQLVGSETIADYVVGETYTLNFVDTTIRPVTENTVIGNNNENVVYTVVVEDANGPINSDDFSFVIVYNGNLGKDYAYPGADPTVREYTFVGDVVIVNGNTYINAKTTNRTDVLAVDLGDGSVKEALLYISYNWDNVATGDFNSWNTTFNGQVIAPIANYRDQGNLGNYGTRAYGLVVYNVTGLVVDGDNTFVLNKSYNGVAVYPTSLIV